ncbi:GNAT family N-acetyltransferase [Sporolactobacillus sp. CPB3-1]|uniref:GNAT family N-acetyltransferase n=1 Tax=Sporolactobacillus mangiferae TaxID=2940498 RepID=A0ABT0M9D8_9BACL|nr:GNAT family N-acetyltransferase [Sporolactobacillus mangiferae]MCL1631487.1 GNAT family N-acetyltransferase [Sporolactobacillus mangiferae]
MRPIDLVLYNESFMHQLQDYQFGTSPFSIPPLHAIKSLNAHGYAHPIMVLNEEKVVGFFILEELPRQSIYGIYEHALLFRAFSLDIRFRGQGLAKRIMDALVSFAQTRFPDRTTIVLTVNTANQTAIGLYRHMGYSDTGRTFIGKKGKQHVFELWINQKEG